MATPNIPDEPHEGATPSLLADLKKQEEKIAIVDIATEEWHHRKKLSQDIIQAFIWVNFAVIGGICVIYVLEMVLIISKSLDYKYRIIDQKVIISIITATTVQFGAISLGVSSWLFPRSPTSTTNKT
jgi:hypothetical protein